MIKGLTALNELYKSMPFVFEESKNKIRSLEIISKELKALEIIKRKVVLIDVLFDSEDVNDYNEFVSKNRQLTQKEYDLLKDVLL